MKQCFKCKRKKELSQFYTHPQMADGHLGKCKSCTKKDAAERYADPEARKRIAAYERRRFQTPERKKKVIEYNARMRARNPGKARARTAIANALRDGKIVRHPCVVCGNPKSEAHHSDYRRPFFIKWLCFKHHREEHHQTTIA